MNEEQNKNQSKESEEHSTTYTRSKNTNLDEVTLNTTEIPLAGFWIRVWAYLFDLFVVSSLNGIVLVPFYLAGEINEFTIGVFSFVGIISTLISFGYFTVMTKLLGQTLGKMVFGIKVYSTENRELLWLDVIFREVIGRYIHQSLVITNLFYLIVAFSPEKRGLHDRIGQTFVGTESRKTRSIIERNSIKNKEIKPDMA